MNQEIRGNTSKVYLYVLKHGSSELKDVQRGVGLSSASLASSHLGKLTEAGLVTRTHLLKRRFSTLFCNNEVCAMPKAIIKRTYFRFINFLGTPADLNRMTLKKPHRRHRVTLPDLKHFLDSLTVKSLMTPSEKFFYLRHNQSISEARELMQKHKFSAAPLKEKTICRYVRLEMLERDLEPLKPCEEVAEDIGPGDRIAENTNIENSIEVFAHKRDSSSLFVTEDDSIIGLVTAADLDKIPVKIYFFTLISALESLLLDIIGEDYPKYKSLLSNPKDVEDRCRRCGGKEVGLDEYNYLMTREIFEIVLKSDIRKEMGVTSDSELADLKEFRNDVAHGNYIIVSDTDIGKLMQKHDQILKYMNCLNDSKTFFNCRVWIRDQVMKKTSIL